LPRASNQSSQQTASITIHPRRRAKIHLIGNRHQNWMTVLLLFQRWATSWKRKISWWLNWQLKGKDKRTIFLFSRNSSMALRAKSTSSKRPCLSATMPVSTSRSSTRWGQRHLTWKRRFAATSSISATLKKSYKKPETSSNVTQLPRCNLKTKNITTFKPSLTRRGTTSSASTIVCTPPRNTLKSKAISSLNSRQSLMTFAGPNKTLKPE